MRTALKWVGGLVAIAVSAYFGLFVYSTLRDHDLSTLLSRTQVLAIFVCGGIYALVIPITAWAWRRLLLSIDLEYRTSELTLILGITQPAKYLPGNVGQHIGRAALALGRGMPVDAYFGTVIAETALTVGASVAVGLLCLGFAGPANSALPYHSRPIILGLLAILLGLGALAMFSLERFSRSLTRLLPLFGNQRIRLRTPRRPALAVCLAAYSLNYLLIGVGLASIASTVMPVTPSELLLLTGAFALAWVVGFFTPGAPAGLGVREGVMVALLGSSVGTQETLVIILALRLATTLGDVSSFGLGALLFARDRERRRLSPPQLLREGSQALGTHRRTHDR